MSKRIFVDTSAWIEIILKGEKFSKKVADYFVSQLEVGSKFFTNDYVLDEAWTRLITQQSFSSAKALRIKTKQAEKLGKLAVIWTDEVLFNRAWETFAKFSDRKLSFTDSVIMTMVRDFRIDEIMTLDQGFKKAGLIIRPIL
jgi:predicted nucleic acid-binding protein